ncbi:MAG: aspartate carbamoyltransferase [Chloroflexota bacterium]
MDANQGIPHVDPGTRKSSGNSRLVIVAGAIVIAALALLVGYLLGRGSASATTAVSGDDMMQRQATVAASGAHVMPFDLTRTKHKFTDNEAGGIEAITTNDPNDKQQVGLIQMHLQMEQGKFASGDFTDPAGIHGDTMPGIAGLNEAAKSGRLQVKFESLPNGAQLIYSSKDAVVVAAVHDWFAAQRSDHGSQ